MAKHVAASVEFSVISKHLPPEIRDNAGDFHLETGKRPHNFDCVYIHAFFDNQSHSFCVREGHAAIAQSTCQAV